MARNHPLRDRQDPPFQCKEHPVTELAGAFGLPAPGSAGFFDYDHNLALTERLRELCVRCIIRFGLPEQNRELLGNAIGVPKEPILRNPHQAGKIDPRWEALANALRMPLPDELPIVHLRVGPHCDLSTIVKSLPSLITDLDFVPRARHKGPKTPAFRPIPKEVGESLQDRIAEVQTYGDSDTSPKGPNRVIALHIHRQMSIFKVLGSEWTLVNALERAALGQYARATSR
jgi:hypothetical protein